MSYIPSVFKIPNNNVSKECDFLMRHIKDDVMHTIYNHFTVVLITE